MTPAYPPSSPPPAAPRQSLLQLPLNQRVPLVKLDTVIAARGENADTIYAHVDNGELHWGFNLASNPGAEIRDLRFWSREVRAFALAKSLDADCVAAHQALHKFPVA